MQHRFRFIAQMQAEGHWSLGADEALHLAKVLRLPLGAAVEVTDGRGRWALGTVAAIGSKEVSIAAAASQLEERSPLSLEFAIGALKPGALDEILPALTELGLDHIHIFQQQDSAKSRLQPKVVERWQRIVVQSAKQCKRAWLPEIHQYEGVEDLIAQLAATSGDAVEKILLRGAPGDVALNRLLRLRHGRTLVVAGGEKGLSDAEEQRLLAAAFQPASLGPHVLRAVTAAVAAAATMSLHRTDLC